MDVIFSVGGNVEVEHHVDIRDIQASRRDVRGYKDVALAGLEFVQRTKSLGLRQLAVQADGLKAQVAQQQRHAQCVVARGHEDNNGLAFEFIQQICQVAVFVLGGDEQILLN